MFVSPAARRGRRALSALILLLLCLLAGAGCAARDRSAAYSRPPCPLPRLRLRPPSPPPPLSHRPPPAAHFQDRGRPPTRRCCRALAAAWAIDAERGPSAARLDAMQPYCRPHTPRAHWWVCTNDEGRVTALDLSFVQAGGEILSELRGLSALRYLNSVLQPVDRLATGVGPTPEPATAVSAREPVDIPAAGTGPTPEPGTAVSGPQPIDIPAAGTGPTHEPDTLYLTENPLTGCLPAGWRDQGIKFCPRRLPPSVPNERARTGVTSRLRPPADHSAGAGPAGPSGSSLPHIADRGGAAAGGA